MQQERVTLGNFTLLGLTVRTNNQNEMDANKSKIGTLANIFWGQQVANEFKYRTNPGVTYCVYTNYESDEHGEYTFFIGEQIDSLTEQNLEKFSSLEIVASNYEKFTTEPGKIPDVVINAWQQIWNMDENQLGGKRQYVADFEIHDQRASNPNKAIVDIYIGIT